MHALSYDANLVTLECWSSGGCGVNFAIPRSIYEAAKAHGTGFYCPRGHHLGLGESDVEKLKKELELERKRKEWAKEAERKARHAEAIAKGKAKAQAQRLAHGVCPCCNRSFRQLRRHMRAKHPEFVTNHSNPG